MSVTRLTDPVILRERAVIEGLTSTAVRLIGICVRDGREDLVDEAICGLKAAIEGLEKFSSIAGCDCGADYTIIAMKQIVVWMKGRDIKGAEDAMSERYRTSPDAFCLSIRRAQQLVEELGL